MALARQDGVDYFLVFGTCRALAASFFFWLAASAFACFCAACLLVAFGDLSPINIRLRCTPTGVNSATRIYGSAIGYFDSFACPDSREGRFAQADALPANASGSVFPFSNDCVGELLHVIDHRAVVVSSGSHLKAWMTDVALLGVTWVS